MVNPGVVCSAGRRLLHVVGVVCVLGFTTSFAQLPGFRNQQEIIPSGFRSRALLSTSGDIKVRLNNLFHRSPEGSEHITAIFFLVSHVFASLSLQAFTPKEIIGFSIGSVSSMLYLCSRLPQMYTNVSTTMCLLLQMYRFVMVLAAYCKW